MRACFVLFSSAILASLFAGCGDDDRPLDAGLDGGVSDAGQPDTGPPDSGPSYLFGPCTTDEQCPEPGDICRDAAGDGWAGGFCTRTCTPPDRSPCDDGVVYNHCLEQEDGSGAFCEQRCLNGIDCMRDGYTCVGDFGGGRGMCVPVCSSDEECGAGTQCNLWDGTCVATGSVPTTGEHGDSCSDDMDCRSNACLLERGTTGVPSGWNGGFCFGPCILPNGYNSNTFYDGTDLPQGTCPTGDVCFVNGSLTRGDLGACLPGCTSDADCRAAEAYECLREFALASGGTATYTTGICFPIDCNMTTSPCPTGYTCRTITTTTGSRNVCERM